uniref:EF-hand domain-containing protein n=1 Tax=Emiliania huxleyi TaxID=2903 RepID=A0A7S3WAP6_EMIHU
MAVAIPPKRLVRRPVATRKSLPFARLPLLPSCIISLPTPITQAVDVECSGVLRARDLRRTFMLVDRQLGFTVTRRATDKVLSQYEGDGDHAVTAEEVARLVEELQRASPQALTVALESEDVRTRWRAASELKQDAAALELQAKALSLRLKHQDPGVRLVVLDVLAACPPAALAPVAPQLSELLADGVWYVREAAVLCLAALDPHVLRSHAIELIDALEDESDAVGTAVRQAAIDALGSLRPDSISSYLLSRTQGLAHDPRRALRPQYARREGQQHRPPPPPNAQPSTLAKVANRMRGTGSASRTVASPVRTVRSQPDQQQAAGTRRKPAGGLYSAHRTFAPVSWPGARLPPGMRDDDLHSEPGRIAPASRPSRLDLARHGCNSSGGVSEPEASSPLARPSRLEAARQWAAQGEPLMNAALEEISSLSRSVGEVQQRPMSGPDPATLPVPSLVGQLSSGHQQQQWQQQQQQQWQQMQMQWQQLQQTQQQQRSATRSTLRRASSSQQLRPPQGQEPSRVCAPAAAAESQRRDSMAAAAAAALGAPPSGVASQVARSAGTSMQELPAGPVGGSGGVPAACGKALPAEASPPSGCVSDLASSSGAASPSPGAAPSLSSSRAAVDETALAFLADLRREMAVLREELDLRKQVAVLVSETRSMHAEMMSLRPTPSSESGCGGGQLLPTPESWRLAPVLAEPVAAPAPLPERRERSQAEPWGRRGGWDEESHAQSQKPPRHGGESFAPALGATPLEALVRHLRRQAAAKLPCPTRPEKAGLPRPHAQRAHKMLTSAPVLS